MAHACGMEAVDLGGLWVPIVTPLAGDGQLDEPCLDRLARRLLADGAAGIVALGTTGEPATLDDGERARVVEICAAACADAGKLLMVGAGSNCTRSTIETILDLEAVAQPAAVLVVVPYYTRPSETAIVEHYRATAEASSTPIVVYNVPHRTGRGLAAPSLFELANIPGIVGLKQGVGALDVDTLRVLRSVPETFQVLAGDDAFIVPTILMGGVGTIAAAAHLCTRGFARMVDAARAGRTSEAKTLANSLLPVVTTGFKEPSPAGWKAALHALGELTTPDLRPPMSAATGEGLADLMAAITAAAV